MAALVALEHDGPIARDMQSKDGLEFYRHAFDKLVKLGFATRSGEHGKPQWTITDLGRERVARWRAEQGL